MSFSGWLIMFCGAVMLVVIVDIILPQGRMSSYVKTFSILIVFLVIVSPVINFFNNFDADTFEDGIKINESIIANISSRQIENSKSLFISKVKSELECDITLDIDYFVDDNNVVIESVYVYLSNVGISQTNQNINIKDRIVKLAQDYFNIQDTQVIVYE